MPPGMSMFAGVPHPLTSPLRASQATYSGGTIDAFVTKINASGNALVYSTYLGGSIADSGNAIAVDGSGNVYLTGRTGSIDFPTSLYPVQDLMQAIGMPLCRRLMHPEPWFTLPTLEETAVMMALGLQ